MLQIWGERAENMMRTTQTDFTSAAVDKGFSGPWEVLWTQWHTLYQNLSPRPDIIQRITHVLSH